MKILFVTKGYHSAVGGAESASKDWFLRIKETAEVKLLTDTPSIISRAIKRTKLSFLTSANPLSFLKYYISTSRSIKKASRKFKPDLVHIMCYSGFGASPPKGIPTLITLHDEPFLSIVDTISPGPFRFITSVLRKTADFIRFLMLSRNPYLHATGTTTSELAKKKFPELRAKFIPNPIHISPPQSATKDRSQVLSDLGLSADSKLVLTVGNINFRKALHKILDAASLSTKSQNFQFVIVGRAANFVSRAYFRNVRKIIKLRGLDNIHLLGFVSKDLLHNLYSHADIYLSASISEACNLSLIEAGFYGLPIVSTDVGAARDIYETDKNTLLIPRNSSGNDIIRALNEINRDEQVDRDLNGILSNDVVIGALKKFYRQILGQR